MPRPFSFTTTVRHFFSSAVGLTHASSVMPVVRSSEAESAIDTMSFTPSNESAEPVFAVVVHVAPEIDASVALSRDVGDGAAAAGIEGICGDETDWRCRRSRSALRRTSHDDDGDQMRGEHERGRCCAIQLRTAIQEHGGGGPPKLLVYYLTTGVYICLNAEKAVYKHTPQTCGTVVWV